MRTRHRVSFSGIRECVLGAALLLSACGVGAQPEAAPLPLPTWAESRWSDFAQSHRLRRVEQVAPSLLVGDFDGDGRRDVAILVEQRDTQKTGIVFLHRGQRGAYLVGAGHALGNAGDDFRWMDRWKLGAPTSDASRADRLVVEREGSASGMIDFARGRHRWKQLGD